MLKILKAEISYNKTSILLMYIMLLLLSKYSWFMGVMGYITLNSINTLRNKEFRERKLAILPVSIASPAVARIILHTFPFIIFTAFTFAALLIIDPDQWKLIEELIYVNGILITIFSLYFILRDKCLYFFRRIGFTQKIFTKILVIFILVTNLLGIYTMIAVDKDWPNPAVDVIKFFREDFPAYNPFSGEYGSYYFLILSMVLAVSTIYTYSKRKSYLE